MSRLRKALEICGVQVHRQRRNFALAPEWSVLLDGLCKRDRDDLHRFAGWCSTFGNSPEGVTSQTFEAFYTYLEEQMTQRNPRERGHAARRAWNRVVGSAPNLQPVSAPDLATQRALRWEDFPTSLQMDVVAYRKKALSSLLPDDDGRTLKPVTVDNYLIRVRVLLTALVDDGMSTGDFQTLRDVVEPEIVKRGLRRRQQGRALDDKARMDLHSIATAVLSISRTIGVDDQTRKLLKSQLKKVRYTATGMTEKNKKRLAPLLDPKVNRTLHSLSRRVSDDIGLPVQPTIRQAQRMQMAVLVKFLIHVPIRILNAAELMLDQTIIAPLPGTQGLWRLSIPADDVKNNFPIDANLGADLSNLLELYVSKFRPVLLNQPNSHLFLSQTGLPKGPSALSKQFSAFLYREAGLIVNVHLMRHRAAHLFLQAHPGQYEVVRRLLGHKNIDTMIRMYSRLEDAAAFARYDQVLVGLDGYSGEAP